jgi:hypothetical protein
MRKLVTRFRKWRLNRLLGLVDSLEHRRDVAEVKVILLKRRMGLALPRPEKTQVLENLWDADSTRGLR